MTENQRIVDAAFRAIDELNMALPAGEKVEKSLDIKLSGPSAVLDSLGLVNLVVETEQQIEDEFGVLVNLADEKAMAVKPNPFRTLGSLVQYIASLLKAEMNA